MGIDKVKIIQITCNIHIRLDSTIRLFHAGNFQHLQDIDAGAFITKMLGMFLSLSLCLLESF